jgi:glucose-6-phosphate dehydrogenase assembly protein OpcA
VIYDLPDTTTGALSKKIVDIRESGGAVALGRVMTLLIITEDGPAEEAIRAANDASREHPCRVGGDAGASEVIVLRLYGPLAEHGDSVIVPFLLPDAPIVAWWPGDGPDVPVDDSIGRMAQRRITDAARSRTPIKALQQRASRHAPGDTDLAWSRITLWRGLLAAALDEPPYESVLSATVSGGSDSPSTDLIAAWLALFLKCPVKRIRAAAGTGMLGVDLERSSGVISLQRPDGNVASLTQPGQPERRIALAPRADRDCLAEELRRLDPDDVFGEVVTKGLDLVVGNAPAKKAATTRAGAKPASGKAADSRKITEPPASPLASAPAPDAPASDTKKTAPKPTAKPATKTAAKPATARPTSKAAPKASR